MPAVENAAGRAAGPAPEWLRRWGQGRLREFFDRFFSRRLAYPVVLGVLTAVIVFNETTFRSHETLLRDAVAITDARLTAGRLMQALAEAESAQRGFLLTGRNDYLEPMEAALQRAQASLRGTLDFLRGSGVDGGVAADRIERAVGEKLGELGITVQLKRERRDAEALAVMGTHMGLSRMQLINSVMWRALDDAHQRQQALRQSIFSTHELRRWMIHALALLVAVGMLDYMRRLREQMAQQIAERERNQRLLEAEVDARTQELQSLARHLQSVSEEERAHLARELHDELGGLLTAIKLDLARLRGSAADNAEHRGARIAALAKRVDEVIALKRRLIENLRPSALDHLGLSEALRILCREVGERLGLPIETDIDDVRMHPEAELTAYRVVQEALTNVQKYAQATQVAVCLRLQGKQALLEVNDDGLGFDLRAVGVGRHGLAGMRHRVSGQGGHMHIESAPGMGTHIRVRLPAGAYAAGAPEGLVEPAATSAVRA